MTGGRAIALIAGREIRERLESRLLRWLTLITAVIVVAAIAIPAAISSGASPTTVGLVGGEAQLLSTAIARQAHAAKVKISTSDVASLAAGRTAVRAGKLDVALSVSDGRALADVKQSLDPAVAAVLHDAVDLAHLRLGLAAAGIPLAQVLPALREVPFATQALSPPPAHKTARYVAALVASILMYVALGLYGAAVASGVAQEKTSRTAEVLLAAVRPRDLLAGKVLGIGLCGLGQLAVAAAAGLVTNAIVHSAKIPSSVWGLLPAFLAYFAAGFALYSFAYAAAGSMVARMEEVQFIALPFGMFLLIGYLLVYAAVGSPDATWLQVASFVPPLTASLMPVRIALGHVAAWQYALNAVLMLLSIYGTARLAARIYGRAIMRGGGRLRWSTVLRREP